jgi:hypothetical protein
MSDGVSSARARLAALDGVPDTLYARMTRALDAVSDAAPGRWSGAVSGSTHKTDTHEAGGAYEAGALDEPALLAAAALACLADALGHGDDRAAALHLLAADALLTVACEAAADAGDPVARIGALAERYSVARLAPLAESG